jgi:AcrR family transcriptional regulator
VPDPIWLRPEQARLGRPAERSRAEITAAAVAVADRDGLDAVSMRRVAAELGTGAASLYRYLDTRDDLLDLMIDSTAAEYELAAPTGDAVADLVDIGRQARAIMYRHPWLAALVPVRPTLGPHSAAVLEHALDVLADHPAATGVKFEAFAVLHGVSALFAQAGAGGAGQAAYLQHLASDGAHPRIAAALAEAPPRRGTDVDALLARILTGLLDA